MGKDVELNVKSGLKKIVEELAQIRDQSDKVGDSLKKATADVAESINNRVKQTDRFLGSLRSLSGRVADQMRNDFKSLVSINAIGDSLRLSSQFRGSVQETFQLSDAIRKLGGVFKITGSEFTTLQTMMVRGLGEVGLSSDVATRSMEGLAGSNTPVSGKDSLVGYGKTSGELASITRQQGKEGDISKLIAQVIQSRGGDVNDMKQVAAVAEDVRRVFNSTGTGAAETLSSMKEIFTSMSKDFREKVTSRGLANLAAAATVGGPNSTKFLEEYLGKSPIARSAMDAQGMKGVISNKGIDVDKFRTVSKEILGRVGGDPRLAAKTLGLSEEAAEGFVRLSESLNAVKDAQDKIRDSAGDLDKQYKDTMGFGEGFRASINRVKALFASPLSAISQGGSDALAGASRSNGGAAAVVAGGGLLAALLAGVGLRGVGKGLGGIAGGLGQAAGGMGVPVRVMNWGEKDAMPNLPSGVRDIETGAAGAAAGGGKLATAGLAGLAAVAGLGAAKVVETVGQSGGLGEAARGIGADGLGDKLDSIEKAISEWGANLLGLHSRPTPTVRVEMNKRDLKEAKQPSRGASF